MLICASCSQTASDHEPTWCCCSCGGYLTLLNDKLFPTTELSQRAATLWRYREALGIACSDNVVSLGEGFTPLLAEELGGQRVLFKADQLCPTGSFKDRGASVMISKLKEWGISRLVIDSSGNAGASVAAYAAKAGIVADVYIPSYTSGGKSAQIKMYGANLVKVPGSREDTTAAAVAAASESFYGSHNWSPFFVAGLKTLAYEICEQLAWQAPDWVVVPVGGGSLVLGVYHGLRELLTAGLITRMPRIVGVQADACSPVYQAWKNQKGEVTPVPKGPTIAEGISIANPVKGRDILSAITNSRGLLVTVNDEQIMEAIFTLSRKGIYVEPTAAAAPAAVNVLRQRGLLQPRETVVVELTGSGLKATDKFEQFLAMREQSN